MLRKRGQMRIIEALIACLLVFLTLSMATFFSNVYVMNKGGNLNKVGMNIIDTIDDSAVIEEIIEQNEGWETKLKSLIDSLLPPDIFYNLTIYSTVNGETIAQTTNIFNYNLSSSSEIKSFQQVVTLSLPITRNETMRLDVILIIDRSGSMSETEPGDEYNKMYYAKEAAKTFIDQLNSTRDHVGLVSFSTEATLDAHLTSDFNLVKQEIDQLSPEGWTNIGDAINFTIQEFQTNGRNDSIWAFILLSDGDANRPYNETYAREYALEQAAIAREMGIRSYTIGLGANTESFDEDLLRHIASETYYYAPSAEDLTDIYLMIAEDLMFEVRYDVVIIQLTLIRGG